MAATLRSGPRSIGTEPHAAAARDPGRGHAEVAADADQRFLDPAYVVDDLDVVGQGHDRVADQLARTVEGDLAAAVHVDHGGTAGVGGTLVRVGPLAGGEDGWVLEQQHRVGRLVLGHGGVDLALEVPGGDVLDGFGTETGDAEVEGHARSLPLWMNAGPWPRSG